MKITITPKAAQWFKNELTVESEMGVRFYGKVYGNTQIHEGFSVGMSVDTPENPIAKTTADGILFYADEADEWFFKGYDLTVDLDEKLNEPKYLFHEE